MKRNNIEIIVKKDIVDFKGMKKFKMKSIFPNTNKEMIGKNTS